MVISSDVMPESQLKSTKLSISINIYFLRINSILLSFDLTFIDKL